MLGQEVISGQINNAFKSRINAQTVMDTLGVDLALLVEAAPINDDVPPNGVTNLVATAIYNGVKLTWDAPPPEDAVRLSRVEITPDGEATDTQEFTTTHEATVFGLDSVSHDIRVMLVDEWGLESAWSEIVTVTPISTAETDLDLAYKQAQGTLQGLIEAVNLAGPSAPQGIIGNALAATQANNMLPVIESDMEMWTNTAQWPPPDAVLANNTPIISSDEPIGHTLSLERKDGHYQIKHERATPSTNYAWYVTQWREERRVQSGKNYIAQATVTGPAGAVVSIAIENADDASGTNMTTANEAQVTLGGGTQKIYVAMLAGSKPYVRIRLGLHTDSTTVWWYKFMLEEARSGATEPSPWNSGIIATGSISARALTAFSANVVNAVFQTASIQDGVIANLKADKIIAGELQANVIVANGKIQAGGAVLDAAGMYLVSQNTNPEGNGGANGFPSEGAQTDWLSSPPLAGALPRPHSGIAFFDDSNDPKRGILIRSRGVSGTTKDGYISIGATPSGTDLSTNASAHIAVRAAANGTGTVAISHRLDVNGEINLPNNSISSDEINALDVRKLSGGGVGANVDPALLPEIQRLRGRLSYGEIANTPDLSNFVKDSELANKLQNLNFTTAGDVRRIVRDMVKASALT
jgi:hypothetical protein